MTNILHVILHTARAKDFNEEHGAARLRGAIERFKRQFTHNPWCRFTLPERKRVLFDDAERS